MTKAEVVAAQRLWAKYVTEQDVEQLLELYDFGDPDEPVLFKPTLADVIRLDRAGPRAMRECAIARPAPPRRGPLDARGPRSSGFRLARRLRLDV